MGQDSEISHEQPASLPEVRVITNNRGLKTQDGKVLSRKIWMSQLACVWLCSGVHVRMLHLQCHACSVLSCIGYMSWTMDVTDTVQYMNA